MAWGRLRFGIEQIAALLVMAVLFLVLYASFNCPRRQHNPEDIDINFISWLSGQNYRNKILNHREYDIYRFSNKTYLDYATKAVWPESVIYNFTHSLQDNLYGNPHSESPSSELSSNTVDALRSRILKFLRTDLLKYSVIFTHSNSHALKTFIEAFPFNSSSQFVLTDSASDNLLGLKSLATDRGATVSTFRPNKFVLSKGPNLIALPLVDAFTGASLDEKTIAKILELRAFSLVDASLAIPYSPINLTETPFSALTFGLEKWFGFPQLGVLVVSNSLIPLLRKPYFGGGTLVYALPNKDHEKPRMRPSEKFEDGSLPFLNIAAVDSGFAFWRHLGPANVRLHTEEISRFMYESIANLTREDGSKLVKIYAENGSRILSFNFVAANGTVNDYRPYLEAALHNDIFISGGCQGTPGSCARALGYVRDVNASEIGALRASVGWATTEADIERLCAFIYDWADEFSPFQEIGNRTV
jgi:molybdenum cofactor sulfurtransferase